MAPADFDGYFVELAEILARSGPIDSNAIAALRARHDTEQLSALIASEQLNKIGG